MKDHTWMRIIFYKGTVLSNFFEMNDSDRSNVHQNRPHRELHQNCRDPDRHPYLIKWLFISILLDCMWHSHYKLSRLAVMNKETNDVIRLSRKDDVTMSMCINYILSTHFNKKRHFISENWLHCIQSRGCKPENASRKGYHGDGFKMIINIMTKIYFYVIKVIWIKSPQLSKA